MRHGATSGSCDAALTPCGGSLVDSCPDLLTVRTSITMPMMAATTTTSGKLTPTAIAATAAIAIASPVNVLIERRPLRHVASTTSATTAGRVPANAAATAGSEPLAACSQARPVTRRAPGNTKSVPARIAPATPCSLQPAYVASCCASGPGSSMHSRSAARNSSSPSQRLRSTTSRCRIAICPAGPPKPVAPMSSHVRAAAAQLTAGVGKGSWGTRLFLRWSVAYCPRWT